MKSMTLRWCIALACGAGLAACGGGSNGNLALFVNVFGLTKSGLVLQNNGGDDLTVTPGISPAIFATLVGNDANFDITIKTQPAGATCQPVLNGKGKTGLFAPNNISITCLTNNYSLGGTITGLSGSGLTLANGADTVTLSAGAVSFTFPAKVDDDAPYGVTVLTQPTGGRLCTVTNGSGRVGTGSNAGFIAPISVNCI